MKRFIPILLIICFLFTTTGCTDATHCGSFIGINDVEKPNITYKYNALNICLAIIFVETVFVPVVVVLSCLKCPVENKETGCVDEPTF